MPIQPIESAARTSQRGAATLLVVVVLFFVLAMVTAYAGRNQIFEQRTSFNNQRSTQAFEAAEAGLEFAIGVLAGGRVDDTCVRTTDNTKPTFRERHLTQDATSGLFSVTPNLTPTCMLQADGSRECSCPAGAPSLIPPAGGVAPTFQVHFDTNLVTHAGVVRATSRGCSSVGTQCYADAPAGAADAVAEVSVLLGLHSALTAPPAAAITTRGALNLNGSAINVVNADVASRGTTLDVGGNVVNAGNAKLFSTPGTPGSASIIANDAALSDLDADRMFISVFGVDRATYRSQPAAVRITCASDCAAQLATTWSENPGRVIWIDGAATIGSNLVLGSPASPVVLVVGGDLTASTNFQLHGLLYFHSTAADIGWNTPTGTTLIQGAVVAERGMSVQGEPTVRFDPAVLRTINMTQGSLVRIPGSWRDFAAGS